MVKLRRRTRSYLVPVGIGLLSAILGAEWVLSFQASNSLTIPFYNRLYPYVMFRPHENTRFISHDKNLAANTMSHNRRTVHYFSNQDGLRVETLDYQLPKQKPSGQWRVAILGSSAIQLGTTYHDSLPGALRTVLREHYPYRNIEVINAGIQSAVSRQTIAHLLFTVVDYTPDLVILYDGFNDLMLPLNYESRPNFPYNFQAMEAAWTQYRTNYQAPVWELLLRRSRLAQILLSRFNEDTNSQPGLHIGPNARSPEEIIGNPEWVRNHVMAYLSNWERLIQLSQVYGYRPVCVLQPSAVLDKAFGPHITAKGYGLDAERAAAWVQALASIYTEASRQVNHLRKRYPETTILDWSHLLSPSKDHFWDVVHVYDETNRILAEKLFSQSKELHNLKTVTEFETP